VHLSCRGGSKRELSPRPAYGVRIPMRTVYTEIDGSGQRQGERYGIRGPLLQGRSTPRGVGIIERKEIS
jgi:hypothetical protein